MADGRSAMTNGFSLAQRFRSGETVYVPWCGLAAPIVAEAIAREGFNTVALDQQHGLYDAATTQQGIAAIRLAGASPMVRVPLGDFAGVSRMLDFGAEAVVAPMINTVAEARAFAAAAKYPPLGERSWGPARAMTLAGIADPADYLRDANTMTLAIAMIETRTALDNVDAIAATPGIDGLFIGPGDLAITISDGKSMELTPEVEKAIDRIGDAARKAGKIAGAYCLDAVRAKALAKRGFGFVAISSDLGLLRAGTADMLKALKG
jgi:4-hydroxy-2-oxoheptanedioate aldolase